MGKTSVKAPETPDLAAATREGYLADIFDAWGIKDNVATEALVNPVK